MYIYIIYIYTYCQLKVCTEAIQHLTRASDREFLKYGYPQIIHVILGYFGVFHYKQSINRGTRHLRKLSIYGTSPYRSW
jgi:hypothetical protein